MTPLLWNNSVFHQMKPYRLPSFLAYSKSMFARSTSARGSSVLEAITLTMPSDQLVSHILSVKTGKSMNGLEFIPDADHYSTLSDECLRAHL